MNADSVKQELQTQRFHINGFAFEFKWLKSSVYRLGLVICVKGISTS